MSDMSPQLAAVRPAMGGVSGLSWSVQGSAAPTDLSAAAAGVPRPRRHTRRRK